MTEKNRSYQPSKSSDEKPTRARNQLPYLSQRIALTVSEAADAVGVSERHLRAHLSEIPHVRLGDRVLIPIRPLEEWLAREAKEEKDRTDDIADEILKEFGV